jgi:predicted DNA-binding transcriptional regulator YafY
MRSEKHEVLLRLKAIELLAYWEGRLVTNKLVTWFGISRQQASADIKRYLEKHNPNALKHDPSVKAYVPVIGFKPVLTNGHINEYMELIAGLSLDRMAVALESDVNVTGLQMPDRSVQPEVTREIVSACRNGTSLRILYASMNNPTLHERIISPHTLVSTGFRWHVRAYCHTHKGYRDFILSRIDRRPTTVDIPAPSIEEDLDWNEMITLNIIPNTQLSDAQKALIEKDYGMPDGRLQLTIRKALAHYSLQRYQAAITASEAQNVSQYPIQLQAADRPKLTPYLFGASEVEKVGEIEKEGGSR